MLGCICILLLSLLPILYLSRFDYATGDDFGYGLYTHLSWMNSHTLSDFLRAIADTVKRYYNGWQGTWFSIVLFTLQPEVFSPKAYFIVPYISISLFILSNSICLYEIFVKKFGCKLVTYIEMDVILLILSLQFVPYTTSGIFWYNGVAHYIIPYSMALFSIYFTLKYLRYGRLSNIVLVCFFMTLLGGTNYLAALFALLFICGLILCGGSKKKGLYLCIPVILEVIGLIISFMAPGNKIRGGENVSFSIHRIISTVVNSIIEGVRTLKTYFVEKPLCILGIIVLAVIIWKSLSHYSISIGNANVEKRMKDKKFKYPALVVLYLFGTYCAMFAPPLYAGTDVSGGVPNTIFHVFLFNTTLSLFYLLGWIRENKSIVISNKNKLIGYWILFGISIIWLVACRSNIKDTTSYKCVDYVLSGQANDYKDQMEERLGILLDDSISNAELPEINNEQGPLMHMPVTGDAKAWTNTVVANFYGKKSIIAVSR